MREAETVNEPTRRNRVLRGLTATDIAYGLIGAILLISSVSEVVGAGAGTWDVVVVVASALLIGNVLRGWTDTK